MAYKELKETNIKSERQDFVSQVVKKIEENLNSDSDYFREKLLKQIKEGKLF